MGRLFLGELPLLAPPLVGIHHPNKRFLSMDKHPAKIDVAVLLLFFNRPTQLAQVFAQVRKARPSRLFLYQDGPRNEGDREGIEACRRVVDDIDWDCEVSRHYCERNQGCDPSGFLSKKWAFTMVGKCVLLEDDTVPSVSFFSFCKELLDRYENDSRISMIAGFNPDETTPDVPTSYFFTSVFSIWGWATWRRVMDSCEPDYRFLDDDFAVSQLEALVKKRRYWSKFLRMCRDHRKSGKAYFESIFWANMLLNSGLAVMPTRNLVSNVGLTADSTHYSASLQTLPRRLRRMFTMRRFELESPLAHPRYVMENVEYKDHFYKAQGWGYPLVKIERSMEELFLNLRHGNLRHIWRSFLNRVQLWAGKKRFA